MREPIKPLKMTLPSSILSEEERELPLVIGVMADFVGSHESTDRLSDREFIDIDKENFDCILSMLSPRLCFEVENTLSGDGPLPVDICFQSIADFSPDAVVQKVAPLHTYLKHRGDSHSAATLDRHLSIQLNKILHHEAFLKLEATWRGLQFLTSQVEAADHIKIRILQCTKRELAISFRKFEGHRWDRNPLFRNIYDREFGACGGEPYACIIGDYSFDHSAKDMTTLRGMAKIAGSAHAPFITSPAPSLFDMDDWTELTGQSHLARIFQGPEYATWRSFRASEESKYIGMAMPRFLGRSPYSSATNATQAFDYEEALEGLDHSAYCWINSAYAVGANMVRSFKKFGSYTYIQGLETGGSIEGLPAHSFPSASGTIPSKRSTEVSIEGRREMELSKLGMLPLATWLPTHQPVFFASQSLYEPTPGEDDMDSVSEQASAQLAHLFLISRFTHYIKVIVQDHRGFVQNKEQIEELLAQWIARYVRTNPDPNAQDRIDQPLSSASVKIEANEDHPSLNTAKVSLETVNDSLVTRLSLVTQLPSILGTSE